MERLESKADHESARNSYGGAESGAAFNKSAKAEGHQQELQPAVRGNTADGGLHDFKVSGAHRDVVEIDGSHHNPDDVHQSCGNAVKETAASQRERHMEGEIGNQDGSHCASEG